MENRRSFLAHTGSLLASLIPFRPRVAAKPESEGMGQPVDLTLERSHVLYELRLFAEYFLPVLTAPYILQHETGARRLVRRPASRDNRRPTLQDWQQAARRLFAAVAHDTELACPLPDPKEFWPLFDIETQPDCSLSFRYMLDKLPFPAFSIVDGRIVWSIYPGYWGWGDTRARKASRALSAMYDEEIPDVDALTEIECRLPEMRDRFLALPPLSTERMNAYQDVLPILSEFDLSLPARALDGRELRSMIESSPGRSSKRKRDDLRSLNTQVYASCLCCGHAVVMESLANNHFCKIGRLLRLPEVYGDVYWNKYMAGVIFAVLFHKVVALQRMAEYIRPSASEGRQVQITAGLVVKADRLAGRGALAPLRPARVVTAPNPGPDLV